MALKDCSLRIPVVGRVLIVAVIYVIPTFKPGWWPNKQINLGLDLQGGMHLVLEIDTERALEDMLERRTGDLKESLMDRKVRFRNLKKAEGASITMELPDPAGKTDLDNLLKEQYPDL